MMMTRRPSLFFRWFTAMGACALLFLNGCATPGRVSSLGPGAKLQKVEPAAQPAFLRAERAFNARQYEQAKRLYNALRQRFPRGRAAMVSTYRMGTIYYYEQQYALASHEFEAFLQRNPNSDLTFDVTYNAAASEFEQGHLDRARGYLSHLKRAEIEAQGPRRAEVVYQLAAQVAEAQNDHAGSISSLAAEMQLPLDETARSRIADRIDAHLARLDSRPELERLLTEVSEPGTKEKVAKRIASLQTAPVAASVAPVPEPATPTVPSASSGASGVSGDRLNVGVILPLSGKFSVYGHKALEGILLASGNYLGTRDPEIHLFIEDSASNPSVARLAVDRLVLDHNVMAILGPFNSREALAVGERAQELGVVNLSLSGKEGIADKGNFLFQNALTPKVQLDSLVQHCIKEKQFSRFAVLYPTDGYGKDMAGQFWDLVEKYGGHVVAASGYAPNQQDFQQMVKELAGLADPKFRRLESAKLWQFINEEKQKTGREPKATLPAIVDYDAVFIPDSPKRAAQIAASLTYFDVSGARLLGTTEWNSDQLYESGGRYVEGALFPGGINLNTKNPSQREFIGLYTAAYGVAPDLLASQAYEAMELVAEGLKRTSSSDRGQLAAILQSLKGFQSPLGSLSFDGGRVAQRRLPVYGLKGSTIVVQ